MNRRSFLSTLAAGSVVATSGCIGGGRVVLKRNRTVTIHPETGWRLELPPVGGNGALTCTVRASQPFDIYYFTETDAFEHYETYVEGDKPAEMPAGHQELSQAAVERDGEYGVKEPEDGGRYSISTEGDHYFAVDHSNYGSGVPVDEHAEALSVFVDLKVIKEQSPI